MFELVWTKAASQNFQDLEKAALAIREKRQKRGQDKSSKQEGLFKQVYKTVQLLEKNPRHPGLQTHKYTALRNPYEKNQKVFEAYIQNQTPGAYRVFWCYGPESGQITILAITVHP